MSDETIAAIIRHVNRDGDGKYLFLFPGGGIVRRGRAWPKLPGADDARGYDFWFVFKGDMCVGAILRMDNVDLHAYMLPKYRRQGLMKRALLEHVFPQLAAEGLPQISVTTGTMEGRELWKSMGGALRDERAGVIDLSEFRTPPPVTERPRLTLERRETIRAQIMKAAQLVEYAADALAVVQPQDGVDRERLEDLVYELKDVHLDLCAPRIDAE